MHTLAWTVGSALAMSAIAWVGLASVALNEEQMKKLLLPLVAFSAGSLLGGALLHLLPEAVAARGPVPGAFLPALAGFALFFLMEQFLSWHHGHSGEADAKAPVTYLILLADGLHNFIGGLALGASFIVSTEVGDRHLDRRGRTRSSPGTRGFRDTDSRGMGALPGARGQLRVGCDHRAGSASRALAVVGRGRDRPAVVCRRQFHLHRSSI